MLARLFGNGSSVPNQPAALPEVPTPVQQPAQPQASAEKPKADPLVTTYRTSDGYVEIQPNFIGFITRLGETQNRVLFTGPHIVLPWIDKIHVVDMRIRDLNPPAVELTTKDSVLSINIQFTGLPVYPDIIAFGVSGSVETMLMDAVLGVLGEEAGNSTTEEMLKNGTGALIKLLNSRTEEIAFQTGLLPIKIRIESLKPPEHVAKALAAKWEAEMSSAAVEVLFRKLELLFAGKSADERNELLKALAVVKGDNNLVVMFGNGTNNESSMSTDQAAALAVSKIIKGE